MLLVGVVPFVAGGDRLVDPANASNLSGPEKLVRARFDVACSCIDTTKGRTVSTRLEHWRSALHHGYYHSLQ